MMPQTTTSTRDDAASDVVTLYNSYGAVVGMWSERNGRAMLGDAFYVREDADTAHERGGEHDDYGELSMLFLENKKKETQWLNCPTDAQWVDYPGAVYHHKEGGSDE